MVSLSRTIRAGLLVLTAFGLLSGSAWAEQKAQPEQRPAAAKKADPSPAPAPSKSLARDKAEPYEPGCQSPKDQGEKDLCESIRANDLAAKNLYWVRIGTGAVLLSLVFTGWAAVAAAEAAKAAKASVEHAEADAAEQARRFGSQLKVAQDSAIAARQSADAAQSAVVQAGETAQKELRAYVVVELGSLTGAEAGGVPIGRISLKNVGRTPAYNVSTSAVVAWIKAGDRVTIPDAHEVERTHLVIGPGLSKGHTKPAQFSLLEAAIPEYLNGTGGFMVGGCTVYEDVFGKTWHTQFCHLFRAPHFGGAYHTSLNTAT